MTTVGSPTQVRCTFDGLLTARCVLCGLELVQLPGADVGTALSVLDAAHPAASDARHRRGNLAGWRITAEDLDLRR
jgi:hypothetical protein